MGVGVCFGNGCNNGHIDDNSEIDASGREAVRLDISALLSVYGGFTINADSATDGEVLGAFGSNAAGTALGAKLADATSAGGNVIITPTSNYLFFVADNTTTSGADVLLHTLTATPNAGIEHPSEPRLPDDRDSTLFGDTVEELSGWYCFSEQYQEDQQRLRRQAEANRVRSQRFENPFKGVGRNDPCPCGSGKKFKKCCLDTTRLGSISPDVGLPGIGQTLL